MPIREEPLFWINHAKDLFAKLVGQRDVIEADLGFRVEWDDWPDHKASKLVVSRPSEFLNKARVQETRGVAFDFGAHDRARLVEVPVKRR